MLSLKSLRYLAFAPLICGCEVIPYEEYLTRIDRVETVCEKEKPKEVPKERPKAAKDLVLKLIERKHIDVSPLYEGVLPRFFVSKEIPNLGDAFNPSSKLFCDERVYNEGRIYVGIVNAPKGKIEVEDVSYLINKNGRVSKSWIDIYNNPRSFGIDYFLIEPQGEGAHQIHIRFKQDGKDIASGGFYISLAPTTTVSR